MPRPMLRALLVSGLLCAAATLCAQEAGIRNGTMAGAGVDHSDGKGLLVMAPDWLPVNADTGRGDRISVEPAEGLPGTPQCVHIKTFGSDAGVYQTAAPLEPGRPYILSAMVQRLSGSLAIEAYPLDWGPLAARRIDATSEGWTRVSVGLTPSKAGVHVYLVACPQAEFRITDVRLAPAAAQVEAPVLQAFDLSDEWTYRVSARLTEPGGPAREVLAIPVGPEGAALGAGATMRLRGPGACTATLRVPLAAGGSPLSALISDPASGEVLGESPLAMVPPRAWRVAWPYKRTLFASMGYRWPLRVRVEHVGSQVLAGLSASVTLRDSDHRRVASLCSRLDGDSLLVDLDGGNLAPGEYRALVTVRDRSGKGVFRQSSRIRVAAAAEHETVCDPEGNVLCDGQRFYPIGMYWVYANPADWKPGPARKDAELREMRDAGINTLHSYAFEHNDANDTDENAESYLDMAQEYGFKVMMGLRRDWYQGATLDLAAVERRVRRLMNHPALLCWTLWDEPNFDPAASLRPVRALYDLVNRLDPYHPAMPVMGWFSLASFQDCADINFLDAYPGAGGAQTLVRLLTGAREAMPDHPLWYVGQAYTQGEKYPSLEDQREYVRYALEFDAKAFFWYSYGGGDRGWDSCRANDELWSSTKQASRELARLTGQAPSEDK